MTGEEGVVEREEQEPRVTAFATPWRSPAGRRVRAGERPVRPVAGGRVRGTS
ncbi:hypothetical protein [Saccharothrix syringae]|uniref:hypothetical protein n=1 Tax=Saccharothrix syringae TaxID=103733 RepID=UPI001293CEEE|nr:hypothetical protein [Saccharothrix syringae]